MQCIVFQDECIVELLSAVVGVAKSDSSHLLTRHSAVYCVKLIARRLTHKHHHLHLTQVLLYVCTTPPFVLRKLSQNLNRQSLKISVRVNCA